jgi:hypothetical protein
VTVTAGQVTGQETIYANYSGDSYNTASGGTVLISVGSSGGGGGGGGGGDGGCVLAGTLVLTPSGYVEVQNLTAGTVIEEYSFAQQALVNGTFLSGATTNVTQLVDINDGFQFLTLTDQPMYIENASFIGWLHDPQNLTTSDRIFDPVTFTWSAVTSVTVVNQTGTVYDVVTSGANNFVASGALLDVKVD